MIVPNADCILSHKLACLSCFLPGGTDTCALNSGNRTRSALPALRLLCLTNHKYVPDLDHVTVRGVICGLYRLTDGKLTHENSE
ncbi:hypothetical protein BSPA111_43650 [Buttiauxella sp. A111]|nr:hypothetical protein BSPA111_43650 [Buttiauxella sp. A111]